MKVSDYFKECFLLDLKAGFITAVVALPLAIAFAIASGVPPIMGLYTAVIAGILGSTFGGSKFSITGPTGAMTVIILATVNKYGIEGLLLTGFLAGILQILFGLLKLGRVVKYIPFPIISGFTAGIGVIIFTGQIANALGILIPSQEHIWQTIILIGKNLTAANSIAILITTLTLITLIFFPKITSKIKILQNIPASILALIASIFATYFLSLNVPTVGQIPLGFPVFHLININLNLVKTLLPAAFTIALLGSIEALLCAVVADAMTNTKHTSDKELIGQGIANIVLPFFNAIPSTAAIARTAVNIREGAKTKISGIIHALFLLAALLFFGPIALYIPKAFLAGILIFVSLRMINLKEWKTIFNLSKTDTLVLLVTFGLTIFTDLVFAIQMGMILAMFLLFVRITEATDILKMENFEPHGRINTFVNESKKLKDKVAVFTIQGPFFFGAINVFEQKISAHMDIRKPIIIIRMKHVPFIDTTGVERLKSFIKERHKDKRIVLLSGLKPRVEEELWEDHEFKDLMKEEHIFSHTMDAISYIEEKLL